MRTRFFEIVRSRNLQKTAFVIFWLMIFAACVINLCKREINADACFYIAVSRLLNEGLVPFTDFSPGYTPLSFYMMQVPQLLVGMNFTVLLALLYIIQLFNSYILYRISYTATGSVNLSQFAAILFMMISLLWTPEYILEPFVLLFGLISLLCLFRNSRRWFILSGILCFCSFWSKQYGLGFFILALVFTLWKDKFSKKSLSECGWIIMGFLIGLVVFVSILVIQGVSLPELTRLSGGDYEKDGFRGLVQGYVLLFKMMPLLIVPVLICLVRFGKSIRDGIIVVSFCGIFGFMLQCYVRLYAHYLMLAIPFCALLFIGATGIIKKADNRTLYKLMLFATLLLPLRFFIPGRIAMLRSDRKEKQTEYASEIQNYIPEGSDDVFVSQDMLYVTLLNDYTPPMLKEYGLSNGFVREADEILDLCEHAQYCIVGTDESGNGHRFNAEVKRYLETEFTSYTILGAEGNIEGKVYIRK